MPHAIDWWLATPRITPRLPRISSPLGTSYGSGMGRGFLAVSAALCGRARADPQGHSAKGSSADHAKASAPLGRALIGRLGPLSGGSSMPAFDPWADTKG